MRHIHSFEEMGLEESWATIGTFDGVHRGHQAILAPLASQAHAAGAQAVVVTFYPHPVAVLRGIQDPIYLTSPEERAQLLGALGIDVVLTLKFDRELAALTAEAFMQKMRDHLGLRQLWVGNDFALGRNRQGDIPALREIGTRLGYSVHVIDEIKAQNGSGERISSSRIRALVNDGQAAQAAEMLGRPYAVEGPVIHGDERGRTLGFPTANVAYWPEQITPAFGVYATWTWINLDSKEPKRIPSVTSIGVRPTFDPPITTPRVEAYLIDFDGDLYGQTVRVEFVAFLRPELRFDSAQALIDQMILDTQNAREVLNP